MTDAGVEGRCRSGRQSARCEGDRAEGNFHRWSAVAIVKFVDWPAVTVSVVVVGVSAEVRIDRDRQRVRCRARDGAPAGCAPPIPPATSVGVNTVTDAVPAVAISAAVIAAVNCVALTRTLSCECCPSIAQLMC